MKENQTIATTWLSGQSSCTMVIPKEFAKDVGLDKPGKVIVEKMKGGIFVKPLEI